MESMNIPQSKEHFVTLKSDTVSFLYEILEKFDPDKGSKAFSYFNVCAKNFLIIQSKKRLKNKMRHVSIDDDSLSINQKYQIERYQVEPSPEQRMMEAESVGLQRELILKIKDRLTNKNEIACIDAALTLFENVNDLDFLNKRALFVYLREISGLNAKQLSVAMSNIRKHYREISKKDKNWKKKKIRARFICVLTLFWPNGKFVSKIGKIEGRISNFKKGKNGFGYDPIFIPTGKRLTFGEMEPQKNIK